MRRHVMMIEPSYCSLEQDRAYRKDIYFKGQIAKLQNFRKQSHTPPQTRSAELVINR